MIASGRLAGTLVSFEDIVVGWACGRDGEAFTGIKVVLEEAFGEERARIAIDSFLEPDVPMLSVIAAQWSTSTAAARHANVESGAIRLLQGQGL